MKRETKIIVAALTLMLMLPLMIIPASANSALTQWNGKDANGVVSTDEDCPIVVEHETLTFNINELPEADPTADTSNLDSYVTAEYTFYNPSDAKITAKLAFPFGVINKNDYNASDEKYSITVDGEKIDAEIRHTLYTKYYSKYDFDVNKFASKYFEGGGHRKASGASSVYDIEKTCAYMEECFKLELFSDENDK